MKKLNFIFILIILSFLVIGAVSAADSNSTDIVQENQENTELVLDDSLKSTCDSDNDILKNYNEDKELSANDSSAPASQNANDKANSAPAKTDLKITKYSNFIKNGKTYYMSLTDSKGKAIANKKITVKYNGKTYKKTTSSTGKFGIKIYQKKSAAKLTVSFKGDKKYNMFTKNIKVYIKDYLQITIGNSKLLSNGYLRIYLKEFQKALPHKTLKITIGEKVFTKKTASEGFVILKPDVEPGTYTVTVKYEKYQVSKKIKCINGTALNPTQYSIPTKNGVPDVDLMPGNYVTGDNFAKYTLKKEHYLEALTRDSHCLFVHNKLPKYTFFKTKASPNTYHIIKREKWNVIERAINTKVVKMNRYSYWPSSITVSLKGKSYTYPIVRDIQNTVYTCGPTSASVCSQALKKFNSEKYFEVEGAVVRGIDIPYLKILLEDNGFSTHYFNDKTLKSAVKELAAGGAALIAYLPGHYVAVVDVSPDGKKILVSNSYGSYNVGSGKVPTNWVTLKYFKTRFANTGLVVKLDYKLTAKQIEHVRNFYQSMSPNWQGKNVHERIPNIGL